MEHSEVHLRFNIGWFFNGGTSELFWHWEFLFENLNQSILSNSVDPRGLDSQSTTGAWSKQSWSSSSRITEDLIFRNLFTIFSCPIYRTVLELVHLPSVRHPVAWGIKTINRPWISTKLWKYISPRKGTGTLVNLDDKLTSLSLHSQQQLVSYKWWCSSSVFVQLEDTWAPLIDLSVITKLRW